jgi:Protein of unknown function (DUF3500)
MTTIDTSASGGFSSTLGTFSAMTLYDAFTTEQRQRVLLPFSSQDRDNWDFLPAAGRRGLALRDMTHRQQIMVHQLVGECLTAEAYSRVVATINLEHILRQLQAPVFGLSTADFRDPGGYFFTLFGEPQCDATWSWRLVGHHLSLNFTFVEQRWLAGTPMLFGAEPARFASWRHLADEEDLGFALLEGFTSAEREEVVIHPVSPTDFVTKSVRRIGDVELPGSHVVGRYDLTISDEDREALKYIKAHPRGVAYGRTAPAQRRAFDTLLACYIDRLKPDQAAEQWKIIDDAGRDSLHFAWAGGLDHEHGHYYRIQGPRTLIEFDNSEDNANHIHSVWRDPRNDFGADLLLQHVLAEHLPDTGHGLGTPAEAIPDTP